MAYASDMSGRYSPLLFLAAVGAGGLAVSFFMYLMWLTPHPGAPIPSFGSLAEAWQSGDAPLRAVIVVGVAGVVLLSIQHVRLLAWNVRHASAWMRTDAYRSLRSTIAETQLLAMPLAAAMAVNVAFIAGAVLVPGLWDHREALFPLALAAFLAIGVWSMTLHMGFLARGLGEGGFDCTKNNSLGQMLAVFSHAMVGVGFSASAAMSHVPVTVVIAYLGATFFLGAAIVLGLILLVLGFRSMMENGAAEEATPTLLIMVPILTVVGIGAYRLRMALSHSFGAPVHASDVFALMAEIVVLQLVFGVLGWAVMRRVGYYARWIAGPERSPGSYALVCPGVALTVSGFFLINAGLVKLGLVTPLSISHLAMHLPLVALQIVTLLLFARLNRKLLAPEVVPVAQHEARPVA
jgi:hypothetical protein